MATTNPTLLSVPIAENGTKNTIPVSATATGQMSQNAGFPPETALPLGAGGVAPSREDFNGAFNLLSKLLFYSQKGWTFHYDATQDYFKGCIVIDDADGGRYECIADMAAGTVAPSADTSGEYWKRFSLGDGVPLGAIIPFSGNGALPGGYLLCDGAAVSRTMYPDLFGLIGTTYGEGDGSTTFNLPNLTGRFPEGGVTAGTVKEAGLPNIEGSFSMYSCTEWAVPSGAFDRSGVGARIYQELTGGSYGIINIDASRSSGIYGNSGTVQPASLTVRYIIKAFDVQTPDSALIDITQYANDLANKLPTVTFNTFEHRNANNIFRGEEITESWASLKARTQAGDFSDLYIGDYKEITLTTGEKMVMEIAGIDTYFNTADIPIGHHIDFISRDCLSGYKKMNNSETNNGNATVKNPWLASALYAAMNNESSGVFATLPADLKSHIITKRTLAEERYSAGGAVSSDTSWSWQNVGKLWLPTEIEVFGCNIWSEPGYGSGQSIQYPIFKLGGYKHILKGNGNGGPHCAWWEASARRTNASYFCDLVYAGHADIIIANHARVCAPLCFRIG